MLMNHITNYPPGRTRRATITSITKENHQPPTAILRYQPWFTAPIIISTLGRHWSLGPCIINYYCSHFCSALRSPWLTLALNPSHYEPRLLITCIINNNHWPIINHYEPVTIISRHHLTVLNHSSTRGQHQLLLIHFAKHQQRTLNHSKPCNFNHYHPSLTTIIIRH